MQHLINHGKLNKPRFKQNNDNLLREYAHLSNTAHYKISYTKFAHITHKLAISVLYIHKLTKFEGLYTQVGWLVPDG